MHYLYIKRNVEKVWDARYTLGVRYLSKNTVIIKILWQALRCLGVVITLSLSTLLLLLCTDIHRNIYSSISCRELSKRLLPYATFLCRDNCNVLKRLTPMLFVGSMIQFYNNLWLCKKLKFALCINHIVLNVCSLITVYHIFISVQGWQNFWGLSF